MKINSLNALLVAATGDPTKFQGARSAHGKHSRGRIPVSVKGRTSGRAFVARVESDDQDVEVAA